jgi:hypothetical protein
MEESSLPPQEKHFIYDQRETSQTEVSRTHEGRDPLDHGDGQTEGH